VRAEVDPWADPPDVLYPFPSRPTLRKPDALELIRLVIRWRSSWEIYLDELRGLWVAQGRSPSNCWARFEADTPDHLEEWMAGV
jgi:hypothetical protein